MKRLVVGSLWFVSIVLMYELVWSLTGAPRLAGPILGLTAALLVGLDPLRWFWAASPDRSPMPVSMPGLQPSAE